ncbi:unnamed protein product, partial [Didymodactylos carnosus]
FQKYILLTIDSLHIFRDNEENKIKVIREPNNADVYDLYTSELKRIEETDILYRNLKQSCEQVNFEHQELQKQFNDMKQRNAVRNIHIIVVTGASEEIALLVFSSFLPFLLSI